MRNKSIDIDEKITEKRKANILMSFSKSLKEV